MAGQVEVEEEVAVLRSIYSADGEVACSLDDESDFRFIINIKPNDLPLHLTLKVPVGYPTQLPRIEVTQQDLCQEKISEERLPELMEVLYQTANDNVNTQMMFTLIETVKEWYKGQEKHLAATDTDAGKDSEKKTITVEEEDDFGKKKKGPKEKRKKPKPEDASLLITKKPPMKTATDVIKRIIWDEELNADHFIVGYLDRFEGVMEEPFKAFDWGDLAAADYFALAIPRHRIQYFKYKDEVVWDKTKRLDLVFGSTGSYITIRDVLMKYEKENKSTEEKELCADDDELDESFGIGGEELEESRPSIPNYFISVRIVSPEIWSAVSQIQSQICEKNSDLKKTCIPPQKLHITLFLLHLPTAEKIEMVLKVLKEMQRDLALCLSPATILNFDRLECWHNRILACPIQASEKMRLKQLVGKLSVKLEEAGVEVVEEDREFNPHMTILKLRRSHLKKMSTPNQLSALVKDFGETGFSSYHVDAVQLCSRFDQPRADGYFHTVAEMSLNLDV